MHTSRPMYPVTRPSRAMVTAPCAATAGSAGRPCSANHSQPHRHLPTSGWLTWLRRVAMSTTEAKEELSVMRHHPLGPGGQWKTGQRVPWTDQWIDQYGTVTHHEEGGTFPPCIGRKGECAYRRPAEAAATA